MRKKYKNSRQKDKTTINNDKKDTNVIKNNLIINDIQEIDGLNNLQQRNTISHFSGKPVFDRNIHPNQKLKLNDFENINTKKKEKTSSNIIENIDLNKDKNDLKLFKRKIISHEIGIKVNRPLKIRNQLFLKPI